MSKSKILFAIIIGVLCFGCIDSNAVDLENPISFEDIVGKYKTGTRIYTFKSDSTFTIRTADENLYGKWDVEANILYFNYGSKLRLPTKAFVVTKNSETHIECDWYDPLGGSHNKIFHRLE